MAALEQRSQELSEAKQEKEALAERIRLMQSQLLSGGEGLEAQSGRENFPATPGSAISANGNASHNTPGTPNHLQSRSPLPPAQHAQTPQPTMSLSLDPSSAPGTPVHSLQQPPQPQLSSAPSASSSYFANPSAPPSDLSAQIATALSSLSYDESLLMLLLGAKAGSPVTRTNDIPPLFLSLSLSLPTPCIPPSITHSS